MPKRQSRGDYNGGSTVVSRSGSGYSKPERSLKAKALRKKRAKRLAADAFYEKFDASRKAKPDA